MVTERTVVDGRDEPWRFSFAAGFFGWAVATFFTVLLGALAAVLVGVATFDAAGNVTFGEASVAGIVAVLVVTFLGYVLGGYVAGRMAIHRGALHGTSVVGWAVAISLLAWAVGALSTDAFLVLPDGVTVQEATTAGIVSFVVFVLVALGGAILGGMWGERRELDVVATRERRVTSRGRPL